LPTEDKQAVYLRMLRMPPHETIRSPQAYLFTVAHHVLYEHRMTKSAVPEAVQMTDVFAEMSCSSLRGVAWNSWTAP
jgi:DNA-directed RNA polymerase specialized sigma24 family protein